GMRVWWISPLPAEGNFRLSQAPELAERYRDFLNRCGVEPTTVKIWDETTSHNYQRIFDVSREKHPRAFRDPQLFRGVNQITFQHARALKLHGIAQPVVAVAPSDFGLLSSGDYFVTDWNAPDVALASV